MGFFDEAREQFESKIKVATGKRLKSSAEKYKSLQEKKESFWERVKRTVLQKEGITIKEEVISPRERQRIKEGGAKGEFNLSEAPPPDMPKEPQPRELQSSAIASMGYDKDEQILEIEFVDGGTYHFYGVSHNLWRSFQLAQSKGRFFHNNIYGEWVGPEGDKTYFPRFTYRRIA